MVCEWSKRLCLRVWDPLESFTITERDCECMRVNVRVYGCIQDNDCCSGSPSVLSTSSCTLTLVAVSFRTVRVRVSEEESVVIMVVCTRLWILILENDIVVYGAVPVNFPRANEENGMMVSCQCPVRSECVFVSRRSLPGSFSSVQPCASRAFPSALRLSTSYLMRRLTTGSPALNEKLTASYGACPCHFGQA